MLIRPQLCRSALHAHIPKQQAQAHIHVHARPHPRPPDPCSCFCFRRCRPQAKIFALFDQLLLLNRGSIVYQGPAHDALDFFDRSGFPCPLHENPADHFLGGST